MTIARFLTCAIASVVMTLPVVAIPQANSGKAFDTVIPPGTNFDKALFRLWIPNDVGVIRATLVLTPGSNGDGRPMVEDPVWQGLASRHKLALVGCQFTDKPHEQNFIEQYANASQGSGQALLSALTTFAAQTTHPELAGAPVLLWGMSAGGEFNYEFAAWKPERVIAFVVNKGGIYYTALVSQAARNVPAILFTGGNDLEFRTNTINGLFAVNRRAGALWALADEPGVAHVVGRSQELATIFFEDMLALRLDDKGSLKAISEKSGFIGDLKTKTFQAVEVTNAPNAPTAWLPTTRVARAWQALVTGTPFEK